MNADFDSHDNASARESVERRAAALLSPVEARCEYMWRESQRAIHAYFLADWDEEPRRLRRGALADLKPKLTNPYPLAIADLERYVQYWQSLVPADPDLRAAFAHILADRYPFPAGAYPNIRAALGLDEKAVRRSYAKLYAASPARLFKTQSKRARPRTPALNPQEAVLREAAAALEWIMVPSGATLYCAGDEDDALYAVVSGRLRVVVGQEGGSEQTVAELGRGEMVGLTEVLNGEARADTVCAIRDSELVRLPAAALRRLAEKQPQVWAGLSSILADRLRAHLAGPHHVPNTLATFALLPAGPGVLIADFCRRFGAALAEYGSTFIVDSRLVDERLGKGTAQAGKDDLDQSRLVAWLGQQEIDHRYVVYLSDGGPSAWSDRCLRQADRIFVLADASGGEEGLDASLAHIQQLDPQTRIELVLLQAADCPRPVGTNRWLTGPAIEKHYHVRTGCERDMKRLARRLTGHALGLVLGGGGARGWAHVGVWRALAEAGVEVDLLGGTSMGALIGAAFAAGLDEAGIRDLAYEFSTPARLFDLTLPIVSFFATGKVNALLQHMFGETQIEDLWQPFFCIASNVSRATQAVLTTGPLWEAVRASMAIPGIFAPMLYRGDVLVDGAVLNNLPSDVMERFGGGGPIVAVNVFPDVDTVQEYQFDPSISGWEVLLKQLNPLTESMQVPSLFENLVRILSLNDVQQARSKRGLADVYIRPPVERFKLLDFKSYDEIIEIGYETARGEIDRWLRTVHGQPTRQPPAGTAEGAAGGESATVTNQLRKTLTNLNERLEER